jgi:hypothetical protein
MVRSFWIQTWGVEWSNRLRLPFLRLILLRRYHVHMSHHEIETGSNIMTSVNFRNFITVHQEINAAAMGQLPIFSTTVLSRQEEALTDSGLQNDNLTRNMCRYSK